MAVAFRSDSDLVGAALCHLLLLIFWEEVVAALRCFQVVVASFGGGTPVAQSTALAFSPIGSQAGFCGGLVCGPRVLVGPGLFWV